MFTAASEVHSPQTDPRREAQVRPQSLLHWGICAQRGPEVAPRRAGRPSARDFWKPSRQADRWWWGQGLGTDTHPRSAPGARQGAPPRRPTPHRPTPRRTPGRPPRAGALPRAEDPGRASSRQACELPPSGSPGELSLAAAAEPAAALPRPPHPAPGPGVLPGWGPSGTNTRPRRRRDRPPAGGPSLPSQPVAAGASGAWSAGSPRGPGSSVLGGPRQPARRSKIEPWWRRSEAELCRGRSGYIVSSPDSFSPPFPRLSSLPTLAQRLGPCVRLAVPTSLSSHPTSFVPHPLGPLRPSPLLWPHGPSHRPLMLSAARGTGPQCPERGECLAGLQEVGI